MISLYLNHDSIEGGQWGRDEIYPDVWFLFPFCGLSWRCAEEVKPLSGTSLDEADLGVSINVVIPKMDGL